MKWSSLVLIIWVLAVSIDLRNWVVKFDLSWVVLVVGIVYAVVRIAEWRGWLKGGLPRYS